MRVEDDPEFWKAFWEWFDNLPKSERDRFKYFKEDMAHIYFYNKEYAKERE